MILTRRISLRKLLAYTRTQTGILLLFTALSVAAMQLVSHELLRALSYAAGFLGTALAFLIGFRNNAAYGRWWEAQRLVRLSAQLARCSEILGSCERLKKTPFPMQYTWFMSYALLVFLFVLPLSLAGHLGWASTPLSVAIGYVFVLLEYVGRYVEHPFENDVNDVPMDYLARTIEIDLLEWLGDASIPEPVTPQGRGYLY